MRSTFAGQGVWILGLACAMAGWHAGVNPFLCMVGGMFAGSVVFAYAEQFDHEGGPPSNLAM